MSEFLGSRGGKPRCVSFVHELQGPGIVFWREYNSYAEDFRLWGEGYRELNEFLTQLPPKSRMLTEVFYHDAARDFFQLLVLQACLEKRDPDLLIILPPLLFDALKHPTNLIPGWTRASIVLFHLRRFALQKWIRWNEAESIREFIPRLNFLRWKIWRKLWKLAMLVLGIGKAKAALPALSGAEPATLVTLDDSGTNVNLTPGIRILREFQTRGTPVMAMTSSDYVAKALKTAGLPFLRVATENAKPHVLILGAAAAYRELFGFLMTFRGSTLRRQWLESLVLRVPGWMVFVSAVNAQLEQVAERIRGVLSVYESLPIAVAAGSWSGEHKKPWTGFFPILVGDRPDARHFPAPRHLVYGGQLRDLMIDSGVSSEAISIVGSPTYDAFTGRDLGSDIAAIEARFPKCVGKKLVVVATEAFPHPFIELGPVLQALSELDEVHVVLKVHPSDSFELFAEYVSKMPRNSMIEVVKDCDLQALLHAADLLVCIMSNIIISAAVMGTPNLVCDFLRKGSVVDFVAEGLCFGCSTPEEVKPRLQAMLFEPEMRERAIHMARTGIQKRFNGPNDGLSHRRIVDAVLGEQPSPESPAPRRIQSPRGPQQSTVVG